MGVVTQMLSALYAIQYGELVFEAILIGIVLVCGFILYKVVNAGGKK